MFHTFPFTDSAEELLLTEGEDIFISRVFFGDVVELVYSAQSMKCVLLKVSLHTYNNCSPFPSQIQQRNFYSQKERTVSSPEGSSRKRLSWSRACKWNSCFNRFLRVQITKYVSYLSLHRSSRGTLTHRRRGRFHLQRVLQGSSWAGLKYAH